MLNLSSLTLSALSTYPLHWLGEPAAARKIFELVHLQADKKSLMRRSTQ